MRLLLVEDETELRERLAQRLDEAGYAVDQAADGVDGLHWGREVDYDLAIIDLGLPRLDGLELIRSLRDAGRRFPILVLTARGRWQDKVEGLGAGGDDYLVKPFHVEELLARLNALIRRAAGFASPGLRFGPLHIDSAAQTVQLQGRDIALTAYEYRALEYLARQRGKVVSKSELTEHLYAEDDDRDSNVIEVFIGRLRRKLDPEGQLQPIATERGRGYRFTLRADDDST